MDKKNSSYFFKKLKYINSLALMVILLMTGIGLLMLYSAADGQCYPWFYKQSLRFSIGFVLMVGIAVSDIKFWLDAAYWFYGGALILLIIVETMGFIGMGAQRWIDFYIFPVQPSELMKLSLILALARYFHDLDKNHVHKNRYLLFPLMLVGLPTLLVIRQPDLGTAIILILTGTTLVFAVGVALWKFYVTAGGIIAAIPFLWKSLRPYQQNRILVFLNPERDAYGAGYHITQSKIALGSGGITGKGFLKGTQSHLNFLPERQTDFIFTMYCEEFGFLGGIFLISLYILLLAYGFKVAFQSRSLFGRLTALGIICILFFYAFINMAMVTGLVPVVGVPLPLISYGGTALLTILMGFGFLFCIEIHSYNRPKNRV